MASVAMVPWAPGEARGSWLGLGTAFEDTLPEPISSSTGFAVPNPTIQLRKRNSKGKPAGTRFEWATWGAAFLYTALLEPVPASPQNGAEEAVGQASHVFPKPGTARFEKEVRSND